MTSLFMSAFFTLPPNIRLSHSSLEICFLRPSIPGPASSPDITLFFLFEAKEVPSVTRGSRLPLLEEPLPGRPRHGSSTENKVGALVTDASSVTSL